MSTGIQLVHAIWVSVDLTNRKLPAREADVNVAECITDMHTLNIVLEEIQSDTKCDKGSSNELLVQVIFPN